MKVVARNATQRSALGSGMCNICKLPEKEQIKRRQHLHGMCVTQQPNLRLLAGKGAGINIHRLGVYCSGLRLMKAKKSRWGNNHQSFPPEYRNELQKNPGWEGEELDKAVKASVGSDQQRELGVVRDKEQSSRKGSDPAGQGPS